MKHVFAFASSFNQPLNWNVSSVVRFEEMFQECVALSDCHRAMTSAAFTDSTWGHVELDPVSLTSGEHDFESLVSATVQLLLWAGRSRGLQASGAH